MLNTDYESLYVKARSSAESMLGGYSAGRSHYILSGILVIDEIQHLQAARSGGSKRLLNFFVTLTNVIKVPVLFVGTPKALELFSPTMRSARRAAQFGSLHWNRFEHIEQADIDTEWDRFIKRMWKLQWFEHATPLTKAMKDLFWECTQGIAHIAVTLFYLSQARAVMARREVIDQELVQKVFEQELSMIHPMIKALQSGRDSEIRKFADLDIPSDKIRIFSQTEEVVVVEEELISSKDRLTELVEMLIKMGIGQDIAPIVAAQALAEKPEEDLFGLVAHIRMLSDKPKKTAPEIHQPHALATPLH